MKPPNSSDTLASMVATTVVSISERNSPTPMLQVHHQSSQLPKTSSGEGCEATHLTRIVINRHFSISNSFSPKSLMGSTRGCSEVTALGSAAASTLLMLKMSGQNTPA